MVVRDVAAGDLGCAAVFFRNIADDRQLLAGARNNAADDRRGVADDCWMVADDRYTEKYDRCRDLYYPHMMEVHCCESNVTH